MLENQAPFPVSERVRGVRCSVSVPSLKKLRMRARFSVEQVAHAAGVSPKTIYRMENGEKVSMELAQTVLNVINDLLRTSYSVDDLSESSFR